VNIGRSNQTEVLTSLIGVGALLALSLTFVACPVWLLVGRHNRAEAMRVELQTQQQRLAAARAALTGAKSQLAGLQADLADSPVRLSSMSALNARLADVSNLATNCDLILNELRPGDSEARSHYDVVYVYLSGTGTYRQCATFLQRLRQSLPDVAVASFELAAAPARNAKPATFRLDLRWYAAKGASVDQ